MVTDAGEEEAADGSEMGPGGMERVNIAEEDTKETPNGTQRETGDMEGDEEGETDEANTHPI